MRGYLLTCWLSGGWQVHFRGTIWQETQGSFRVQKGSRTKVVRRKNTCLASLYTGRVANHVEPPSYPHKSTETGLTNLEGGLRLFSPPRRRFPSRRGPGYLWVLSCIPQALLSAPPFPPWLTADPHRETRKKIRRELRIERLLRGTRVARFGRLTSLSSA